MHGLVRCKHECRCSRTRGADVSFRDVTIKIPDRGCDQGCEWRQAPEAWAEIWEKSVSWDWDLGEVRRICALRAPHVLAEGVADGKDSIERWYLSPYVEKPFNSKVIKSFVPELRSRKCFSCFGIPMLSLCALWTLWTFCVPVWIYLFHIFMYGYVTVLPNPQCWLFFFLLSWTYYFKVVSRVSGFVQGHQFPCSIVYVSQFLSCPFLWKVQNIFLLMHDWRNGYRCWKRT